MHMFMHMKLMLMFNLQLLTLLGTCSWLYALVHVHEAHVHAFMQLFTLLGTYLCLYAHVHAHEALVHAIMIYGNHA